MMRWLFGDPKDGVMNDVMASFVPQDDITVLDLAKIVNGIAFHNGPMRISAYAWAALPRNIKRHFHAVMDDGQAEPQTSSKPLPWSGIETVRNSALPGEARFVSSCAALNEPHLCGGSEPIEGQGPEMTQDQIEAMERGGK